MDKTRIVGQKWLANEVELHFLTLKKCTKGQSNRSILSKVIVLTNYKSTDKIHSQKPFFQVQRVSKRGNLTKTGGGRRGGYILHKSNTFSVDNIKSLFINNLHVVLAPIHLFRLIQMGHSFIPLSVQLVVVLTLSWIFTNVSTQKKW